jgi:hypothetical protein
MVTALAAFLAAISGLLGGLNQIGVFDRWKHPSPAPAVTASAPVRTDTSAGAAHADRVSPARRAPAPSARSGRIEPVTPRPSATAPRRTPRPQPAESAPAVDTAVAPRDSAPHVDSTASRAPAAPSTSPARDSTTPSAPGAGGIVPAGTTLELAAQSRICSTTSHPGDRFSATVVVPVAGASGVVVPVGAGAVLELTHQDPPVFLGARADSLVVAGKAHAVSASTVRTQREFVAGPGERGVGVGACIPAGGRITVTLTDPVPVGR